MMMMMMMKDKELPPKNSRFQSKRWTSDSKREWGKMGKVQEEIRKKAGSKGNTNAVPKSETFRFMKEAEVCEIIHTLKN